MSPICVTVMKRVGCHLCEEMDAVVSEVVRGLADIRKEARDVDAEPRLAALFGREVPVLLVNGRKAFKFRVTASQLRRRLWLERRRAGLVGLRRRLGA